MKATRTQTCFWSRHSIFWYLFILAFLLSKEGSCFSSFSFNLNVQDDSGKREYSTNAIPDEFDFVIVGGGTAGAVLANRLSEIAHWKILLLEAGGRDNMFSDLPPLAISLQATALNWGFLFEKQNGTCLGMIDERCPAPRGKGLGGSTIINYMIYNRGNRADYDDWEAAGNEGWSYNDVLPYFMKSETVDFQDTNRTPKRGKKGPTSVEYVRYRSSLVKAFIKANQQLGYKVVDYNGDSQIGADYLQATTKRGKRVTSASAYLHSLNNRKNLHILMHARAIKVIINPKTKTATGVEYLWKKRKYTVRSRKEVILSAGTIQSPQLLMLSGIGPKDHLEELDIPTLVDSPVGQTMYDHLCLLAPTFLTNTTGQSFEASYYGVKDVLQYYTFGQGRLTVPGGLEALAFVKTNLSKETRDVPDIELMFMGGSMSNDFGGTTLKGIRWKQEIYDTTYKPFERRDQFTIAVMLFQPKSKGYIRLKDKNPLHWPLIYHNYLTEPQDVAVMIEGIKEALRLVETPVMKSIGARINDIPIPSCAHFHFGTDPYWECLIRSLASTLYHQTSTCRMGPEDDPMAVVSPKLEVYGVKRLRVVDASVMPYINTGHTQAPVYMIAEKAADMIKDYWSRRN